MWVKDGVDKRLGKARQCEGHRLGWEVMVHVSDLREVCKGVDVEHGLDHLRQEPMELVSGCSVGCGSSMMREFNVTINMIFSYTMI